MNLFRLVSRDDNPLHHDSDYSRRSAHSEPVVYGVCAVLSVLSEWAKGRPFSLKSIAAQFRKPLLVGREYEIKFTEEDHGVKAKVLRGPVLQCAVAFSEGEPDDIATRDTMPSTTEEIVFQSQSMDYEPNHEHMALMLSLFNFKNGPFSEDQIRILLWSSYFVGKVFPGRQALFSTLKIDFARHGKRSRKSIIENIVATQDKRFSLDTIQARSQEGHRIYLQAFHRPPQVSYTMEEIEKQVGRSARLSSKVIFISGASRGFGSVLARAAALHGAKIALSYFKGRDEAEAVASEILKVGSEVVLLEGDVGNSDNMRRFRETILSKLGPLDFLIHNAIAAIRPYRFLEQSPDEFLDFVSKGVALVSVPSYHLLPAMRAGGTAILVSTIFTQKPAPDFSHYIALKGAAEALFKCLSVEFPTLNFRTVHFPKMRTDQTVKPGLQDELYSPIELAAQMLDQL